jgi:hypothetical protein
VPKTGLPWLIFAQTSVTLALLSFAYFVHDGVTQNLVVGAVIAHWLSESMSLGRQVSDQRAVNNASLSGSTTTATSEATAPPASGG